MTTRTPRQTRTPAQRATEALAVADRHVARLSAHAAKLRHELEGIEADLALATRRRDFLSGSPDLPEADAAQLSIEDAGETA